MLLSHRYQFLFVHIAKTGGTSVCGALQKYRWRDPYYLPQFMASKMSGDVSLNTLPRFSGETNAGNRVEIKPSSTIFGSAARFLNWKPEIERVGRETHSY